MSKAKKPSAAEVTPDIINDWKSQFEKVMVYKTEDGKTAYFKEPDMAALDASSALAASNPIKSNVVLAKACFIGGDEEIVTDKEYLLGLGSHLKHLISKVEGELTEL